MVTVWQYPASEQNRSWDFSESFAWETLSWGVTGEGAVCLKMRTMVSLSSTPRKTSSHPIAPFPLIICTNLFATPLSLSLYVNSCIQTSLQCNAFKIRNPQTKILFSMMCFPRDGGGKSSLSRKPTLWYQTSPSFQSNQHSLMICCSLSWTMQPHNGVSGLHNSVAGAVHHSAVVKQWSSAVWCRLTLASYN